jgi:superkiller protein 3
MNTEVKDPVWMYLEKALELKNQGKLTEAIALYKEAAQFYPDNANVVRELGIAYDKQGDIEGVISSYNQTIELNPQQQIWLYLTLIRLLTEKERYDQAIAIAQAAIKLYPENSEVHRWLGVIANKQEDIDGVIKYNSRAIELNSQEPLWVYLTLIQSLTKPEQFEQATAICQAALEVYPDSQKPYHALSTAAEKQGNIDKAVENYQRAIKINPQQPDWVYSTLGRLLTQQENWNQAIATYQQALEIYPENEKLYQYLGNVSKQKGDTNKAIKSYRKAIELNPKQSIWLYLSLGELLIEKEQFQPAITTYRKGLKVYPDNEKLYQSLGRVADKKGDIDQAIKNYKQAIEINPQQPTWLYFSLGQLLTVQEKFESAIAICQATIEQYPNNAEAYRLLGVAQEKAGNIDGIVASYRQAIALEPDKHVWIYYALGQLLSKQERFDEAIALYQDAVKLFPEEAEVYRQLGNTQNQADQLDAAAESFQKAIDLQPDAQPWVYLTLCQILIEQDNVDEAITLYEEAVKIYPENADLQREFGFAQKKREM